MAPVCSGRSKLIEAGVCQGTIAAWLAESFTIVLRSQHDTEGSWRPTS